MKQLIVRVEPVEDVIVGIDPSPDGTAIVLLDHGVPVAFQFCTKVKSVAKKFYEAALVPKVTIQDENARMERLNIALDIIREMVWTCQPIIIGIEDYIYTTGKKGGGVVQIAELGGNIRLKLYNLGYKIRTFHPASVKLAWTGLGDAEKPLMIKRAKEYLEEKRSPIADRFAKIGPKYQEGVADALAIAWLTREEMRFRKGEILLKDMSESMVRVFNRVTDSMPVCLIDRPYMERKTGD
jgi:Holliday junction resolvasome RuvABC endonuclease subunit